MNIEQLKEAFSPWIDDVICEFSKSFLSDYGSNILNYLNENIDKEIENIYKSSNMYVLKRKKALYTALIYLYNHFCWKMSHQKDCPNVKKSCVKLLSQIIKTGIILSNGDKKSEWINRILTAIRLFTGEPALIYDSLLLVSFLKPKYHKAYIAVLKCVLISEDQECITDPLIYMEVILLFRRLKGLLEKRSSKACVLSLACKIKPPYNLISWLMSLNVQDVSGLKYKTVAKQLMRNKVPETLLKTVRNIALKCYVKEKDKRIQKIAVEPSNLFVIDSSSSVENNHSVQDNKIYTEAKKAHPVYTESSYVPTSEKSNLKKNNAKKLRNIKKQLVFSKKDSQDDIYKENKFIEQKQPVNVESCIPVTKKKNHKKSKNKKLVLNKENSKNKIYEKMEVIAEEQQPMHIESVSIPVSKKHSLKKDNSKKSKKKNNFVLIKESSEVENSENTEVTEEVQPMSMELSVPIYKNTSLKKNNSGKSKRNKKLVLTKKNSERSLESNFKPSNMFFSDPSYVHDGSESIQYDKIYELKEITKQVQPSYTEPSFVSVPKKNLEKDNLKKSKKNKRQRQGNCLKATDEPSELFIIDPSPTGDHYIHSIEDSKNCVGNVRSTFTDSFVPVSKNNVELAKRKTLKRKYVINDKVGSMEEIKVINLSDGNSSVEIISSVKSGQYVSTHDNSSNNNESNAVSNNKTKKLKRLSSLCHEGDESAKVITSYITPEPKPSFLTDEMSFIDDTKGECNMDHVSLNESNKSTKNRKRKSIKDTNSSLKKKTLKLDENKEPHSPISDNGKMCDWEIFDAHSPRTGFKERITSQMPMKNDICNTQNSHNTFPHSFDDALQSSSLSSNSSVIKNNKMPSENNVVNVDSISDSSKYNVQLESMDNDVLEINRNSLLNEIKISDCECTDVGYTPLEKDPKIQSLPMQVIISKTNASEGFNSKAEESTKVAFSPKSQNLQLINIQSKVSSPSKVSKEIILSDSSSCQEIPAVNNSLLTEYSENSSLKKHNLKRKLSEVDKLSSIKDTEPVASDFSEITPKCEEDSISVDSEFSGSHNKIMLAENKDLSVPYNPNSIGYNEAIQLSENEVQSVSENLGFICCHNESVEIFKENVSVLHNSESCNSHKELLKISDKVKKSVPYSLESIDTLNKSVNENESKSRPGLAQTQNESDYIYSHNERIKISNKEGKSVPCDATSIESPSESLIMSKNETSAASLLSKSTSLNSESSSSHKFSIKASDMQNESVPYNSESIDSLSTSIKASESKTEAAQNKSGSIDGYNELIKISNKEAKSVPCNAASIESPSELLIMSKDETASLHSESINTHNISIKVHSNKDEPVPHNSESIDNYESVEVDTSTDVKHESTSLNSESSSIHKSSIKVSDKQNESVPYNSESIDSLSTSINVSESKTESTQNKSGSIDSHNELIKISDKESKSVPCKLTSIESPSESLMSKNETAEASLHSESINTHNMSIKVHLNKDELVPQNSKSNDNCKLVEVSKSKHESTSLNSESNSIHKASIKVSEKQNESVPYNSESIDSLSTSINESENKTESAEKRSSSIDSHNELIIISNKENKSVLCNATSIERPSESLKMSKNETAAASLHSESINTHNMSIKVHLNKDELVPHNSESNDNCKSVEVSKSKHESTYLNSESNSIHKASFKVSEKQNESVPCNSKSIDSLSTSINESESKAESAQKRSSSIDSHNELIKISNKENKSVPCNATSIEGPSESLKMSKNETAAASLHSESINTHMSIKVHLNKDEPVPYNSESIDNCKSVEVSKSLHESTESTSLNSESSSIHKASIKVSDKQNESVPYNSESIDSLSTSINECENKTESAQKRSSSIDSHNELIKISNKENKSVPCNAPSIERPSESLIMSRKESAAALLHSESINTHNMSIKVHLNKDEPVPHNLESMDNCESVEVSKNKGESTSLNSESRSSDEAFIKISDKHNESVPYNSESIDSLNVPIKASENKTESVQNKSDSIGSHDELIEISEKRDVLVPCKSECVESPNELLMISKNETEAASLHSGSINTHNKSIKMLEKKDDLVLKNSKFTDSPNEPIKVPENMNNLITLNSCSIDCHNKPVQISNKKDVPLNLVSIDSQNESVETPKKFGLSVILTSETVDSHDESIKISKNVSEPVSLKSKLDDSHVESIEISEDKDKLLSFTSGDKTKTDSLNQNTLAADSENNNCEKCVLREDTLDTSVNLSYECDVDKLENENAIKNKSPSKMSQYLMVSSSHNEPELNCETSVSPGTSFSKESKSVLKNGSCESIDDVFRVIDDTECATEIEDRIDDVADYAVTELHASPSKRTENLDFKSHCHDKSSVDVGNIEENHADSSVTKLHITSKHPFLKSPSKFKVSCESEDIYFSPPNKKIKYSSRASSSESIDILTVDNENYQEEEITKNNIRKSPNFKTGVDKSVCSERSDSNEVSNQDDNLSRKTLKITKSEHFPFHESKEYLSFSDISVSNKSASTAVDSGFKSSDQIRNFAFAATAEIFSSYRNDLFSGEDKASVGAVSKDDVSFYSQELSEDGKSQNLSSDERSESDHSINEKIDIQLVEVENILENDPADVPLNSDSLVQIDKDSVSKHNTSKLQSSDEQKTKACDQDSSSLVSEIEGKKEASSNEIASKLPRLSVRLGNKVDIKSTTVLNEDPLLDSTQNNVSEISSNEKDISDCDSSKDSSSVYAEDIHDHAESSKRIVRNSSKKCLPRKSKSKQNSLCGSPAKRYSLRLKKSKGTDESSSLGIDISQLHLDSPSSSLNPKVTIKRNTLVARMLAMEDSQEETSHHIETNSSSKRETRSSVKSSVDDAIPNTPSYNLRTRRSIIAPGKLKL